jgi:hypothetical protein
MSKENMMTPYNRKDDDMHKFYVPEDLLPLFDQLLERMRAFSIPQRITSEEYWELEAQFCNQFSPYMVD